MFNLFSDTQRQMQDLLLETRSYVGLQKRVVIAETRDKLTVILSRLAIAVVCLVLGGMILLFFSFFLAYIIGQAIGNIALGFACVTAFVLLLLVLFWFMRERWVIQPITTLLANVFTVDEQQLSTEEVNEQLRDSRARMSENFNQLLNPNDKSVDKVENMSNWISRGFAVYEGLRIGLSVVRAFGNIFGHKRRRRRR